MVLLQRKLYFFKGSRDGPTFLRGVQLFPGREVQMLIIIETHITCDFQGGPDPYPPLDLHINLVN